MAGVVFPPELWIADIINAILLFLGSLLLMRFMRGTAIRKWTRLSVVGILLFAMFHEGGEIIYGSGIHGGFPKTLWGSFHILFFGIVGSALFFVAAFMVNREYRRILEDFNTNRRKRKR